MASSIHFLDIKGKPLLTKDYKGDIPVTALERFPLLVLQGSSDEYNTKPVFQDRGVSYAYLIHNDLYVLALARGNVNIYSIMVFLRRLIEVLESYVKRLVEESIRDNFSIIYELLDEMVDFGTPQISDVQMLKQYIKVKHFKLEELINPIKALDNDQKVKVPMALTNSISWRSEGISYKKNEAFLDVVEAINMTLTTTGQVITSEILGKIKIRSQLSGMPDLRLGINEKFLNAGLDRLNGGPDNVTNDFGLEDIKFHQCVRLAKFENDKIITFIPPDGEFELMTYRILSPPNLVPLILVDYKLQNHSNTRLELFVRLKTNFKRRLTCTNLELLIPCPDDIDSPSFQTSATTSKCKIKYVPEKSAILWRFKSIPGGKDYSMIAELNLPSVKLQENVDQLKKITKKPIKVNFQIPYFTTSGLQVRYLRINEPKLQYKSYPWVRYVTQSGDDYIIRMK
ncbi:AP-1 complex subunit mu-1-Iike [Komagataella phaffii CBS 7435]|uniref:Mu1-like medium subunit of the clathrin-associated protein complex (AP-1) n=2 Tax=Komagataella phaffii TaxID=460519 RepID=C4R945_KOMPG|nr:Mu1-like medium subunit of the clathrin-associated protein complex (AP-1) [Komagataella phaffii GS115]AOA65356.1 GQ67_05244T0 [Komagataella phaffii]CAH2450469.1 AP-1 complex subunit mu-1-Iike [Komagataella phaffii CBS 7435]AOA70096.1 GQ68_05226T0 [Komagataella phaffii GS115]CAY72120.1 Mu1-like medium subunit of the clathrin-associated protein complex (AP-1) [Komagataella phaffii GS115]CCA40276.1 AP-1 complex subunit mu-1-Iike [Komagataella phaffii CBS 7435]